MTNPNHRPNKLTSQQLEEIKKLSKQGWSSVKLGERFNCDHTTILFQLGKLKKKPTSNLDNFKFKIKSEPKFNSKIIFTKQERGLTYKDIVEKQQNISLKRDEIGNVVY